MMADAETMKSTVRTAAAFVALMGAFGTGVIFIDDLRDKVAELEGLRDRVTELEGLRDRVTELEGLRDRVTELDQEMQAIRRNLAASEQRLDSASLVNWSRFSRVYEWRAAAQDANSGQPGPIRMLSDADDGVCFLTSLSGAFEGERERVEINRGPQGWILDIPSRSRLQEVRAMCWLFPENVYTITPADP